MKILNTYEHNGYIYEYILMDDGSTRLVYQHRRIWEETHKTKIPSYCVIHHEKGKKNNNPKFLKCMPRSEHTNLHLNGFEV